MTLDAYIQSVVECVPPRMGLRDQIAMELRSHIAERLEHGQPLDDVLRQFGDPRVLAESYLAAVPLQSVGFLRRALAKLIDFLVIVAFVGGMAAFLWMVGPPELAWFLPPLCIISCLLGLFGYTIAAEHYAGQTVGKRVMGIHVVRESGARISLGQSAIRQLPLLGQIFFIDVLFALFTDKKQRAFELITKTRAVAV
ncbi:MAG TPA: RDD family protein [Vicinamibacterales bacterium]|nr:RDD family protein [Vicinamibacterales bacterium]